MFLFIEVRFDNQWKLIYLKTLIFIVWGLYFCFCSRCSRSRTSCTLSISLYKQQQI